jgi:hypothetical protein
MDPNRISDEACMADPRSVHPSSVHILTPTPPRAVDAPSPPPDPGDVVFHNMHRKLCRDMQKTLAAARVAATSSPPITTELLPALTRMCNTIHRLKLAPVTGRWAHH